MGAYTLLQDLTVASNSTSVVLNNFGTITKDDFVKIVVTHVESANASYDFTIHANAQSTQTNYHSQRLNADNVSVNAVRQNNSSIGDTSANQTATRFMYLKLSENDRLNIFSNNNFQIGTGPRNEFRYVTSSGATFTSGITSLTFNANTNGIGSGSRFQIYKLAATKVADITVTSNTTQVDISNLSIDKDSEYLLVSDFTTTTANVRFQLFPNDLTTSTNYHGQNIVANGTARSAGRENNATLAFLAAIGHQLVGYSHIKLSNIGAYTAQHYTIRQAGTSNLQIINNFVSSTAENITSITKLNIVATATSGIAAGSKFTLYKLYE